MHGLPNLKILYTVPIYGEMHWGLIRGVVLATSVFAVHHTVTIPLTLYVFLIPDSKLQMLNTLRTGSFKLFKRPFPGFLTILTL